MASPSVSPFPIRWDRFLSYAGAAVILLVVITGKVDYTKGDSRLSMLTAQAFLEHRHFYLDDYLYQLAIEEMTTGDWMYGVEGNKGNKTFYYFPIGTPVLSLPAVWVANRLGLDMTQMEEESLVQRAIAAMLCALIFLVLFELFSCYLSSGTALLTSLAFFLGSSLISTLGTALWSQDFLTLFVSLVLLELARADTGKQEGIHGIRMGLLLFGCWFVRPTAALFIMVVIAYVAYRHRKALLQILMVAGICFVGFMLFSKYVYGDWLPKYYNPFLREGESDFWMAFEGLLISPNRGVFIFHPYFLLILPGLYYKRVRKHPLVWMTGAWLVLHTISSSMFHRWWGGWCYGPRFYAELVPALALVLLLIGREVWEKGFPRLRLAFSVSMMSLLAFGIYVHTVQGMYNPATQYWNDSPNIDDSRGAEAFNWDYPQFTAGQFRNNQKAWEDDIRVGFQSLIASVGESWGAEYVAGEPFLYPMFRHLGDDFHSENTPFLPSKSPGLPLWKFLKRHEGAVAMLAIHDDGYMNLSDSSKFYLESIGSEIAEMTYRDGYAGVLRDGKVVLEQYGPEGGKVYASLDNNHVIRINSKIGEDAEDCSIMVNGKEYGLDQRGFNVVLFSPEGKFLKSAWFDTHRKDQLLLAVYARN